MSEPANTKNVVLAIDKRELLYMHPGLVDRGAMLGIPEDVTYELVLTMTDVFNLHVSLSEELSMVEDEMYNIFEFMTDPYLTSEAGMDSAEGSRLDDYCREVYESLQTLRGMIPLNVTNLQYLSHFLESRFPHLFYVGGVMHTGRVPNDYMFNEKYFLFM